MDKRIEIADRFASMWRKSREEAGKSQEYMSKALGVSKKTIQNWEAGISSPTQAKGFEWFHVLGVQPLPYYLDLLYPDLMQKLADDPSEENITETLITAVSHLGSEQKKKLLYLFLGNHAFIEHKLNNFLFKPIQSCTNQRKLYDLIISTRPEVF